MTAGYPHASAFASGGLATRADTYGGLLTLRIHSMSILSTGLGLRDRP